MSVSKIDRSLFEEKERIVSLESIVTITHNLGRIPVIIILNSSNFESVAHIEHMNQNQFVVLFNKAFLGKIIYY